MAPLLLVALVALLCASVANADRAPRPGELRSIRAATMRDCKVDQDASRRHPCKWQGQVRVSTVNSRYAWASAYGPNYDNSGILRRPGPRSHRWHMVTVQGGGVLRCGDWTRHIPGHGHVSRAVVHDLGVVAVSGEDWSTPVRCRPSGRFFVPTGKRTGFGPFREAGDSAAALRRAFGAPTRQHEGAYGSCVQAWPHLGLVVTLAAFGDIADPCEEGVYYEARLTDPRWHTATGVHPGGPRGPARRASLRRCRHATIGCGVTGYALELHRTDCAASLTAGVIAHVRGRRVVSLIVRWRSCE